MSFVITDSRGKYVHISANSKMEITDDLLKATRFEYEKASNYITYNLRNNSAEWKVMQIDGVDDLDLDEVFKIQEDLFNKVRSYKEKRAADHKNIEKEINDIYHYIEFSNLNAAQGYKAYKLLKECLIERRSIKDDLEKAGIILGSSAEDYINGNADKKIEKFTDRHYSPRIRKELFGE